MTQAVIETNRGEIVVDLFEDKTPKTVENFVKLARDGFYDGLRFHRVIDDFMIQTGCPKGTGTGDAGYKSDCEIVPGIVHEAGSIAMAHAGSCQHDKGSGQKMSGSCSNGSQFYITHVATSWLDGVHSVFGKVKSGKDLITIGLVIAAVGFIFFELVLNIGGLNLGLAGWGVVLILLGAFTLVRPFLSKTASGRI